MRGPGFCGLGVEGRGGKRAGDWPARPLRPAAAGSSELLAIGPCRARKSSLGPFPGRFGDCYSFFPGFPVFMGVKTLSGS